MLKPFKTLLIIFVFLLTACTNTVSITKKQQQLQALQNTANSYCTLNSFMDVSKNWIMAKLTYNSSNIAISNINQQHLLQVANAFNLCVKNVLLVHYNSNYNTAYNYNAMVIDFLAKNKVNVNKINTVLCNVNFNVNNQPLNNSNTVLVVFVNNPLSANYMYCSF